MIGWIRIWIGVWILKLMKKKSESVIPADERQCEVQTLSSSSTWSSAGLCILSNTMTFTFDVKVLAASKNSRNLSWCQPNASHNRLSSSIKALSRGSGRGWKVIPSHRPRNSGIAPKPRENPGFSKKKKLGGLCRTRTWH
jgi:hypothetical protein